MTRIISRIMLGCALFVAFGMTMTANAETVSIVGNSNGALATATVNLTFNSMTNSLSFTITNTSPFDARITGIGFDLVNGDFSGNGSAGLNNFSGANNAGFTFDNGSLGNVPQFNDAVLDFGWRTGSNFNGGSPNDGIAPGASLIFSASGTSFAGLTEHQIASSIYVRFQRVGSDGNGSDVGVPNGTTPVPEPTTMLLLGSGLVGAWGTIKRRRKSDK